MITNILEAAIYEVLCTNKFEISEFQLGRIPYEILSEEIENMFSGTSVNIDAISAYKEISVKRHPSDDAIMYCLKLK